MKARKTRSALIAMALVMSLLISITATTSTTFAAGFGQTVSYTMDNQKLDLDDGAVTLSITNTTEKYPFVDQYVASDIGFDNKTKTGYIQLMNGSGYIFNYGLQGTKVDIVKMGKVSQLLHDGTNPAFLTGYVDNLGVTKALLTESEVKSTLGIVDPTPTPTPDPQPQPSPDPAPTPSPQPTTGKSLSATVKDDVVYATYVNNGVTKNYVLPTAAMGTVSKVIVNKNESIWVYYDNWYLDAWTPDMVTSSGVTQMYTVTTKCSALASDGYYVNGLYKEFMSAATLKTKLANSKKYKVVPNGNKIKLLNRNNKVKASFKYTTKKGKRVIKVGNQTFTYSEVTWTSKGTLIDRKGKKLYKIVKVNGKWKKKRIKKSYKAKSLVYNTTYGTADYFKTTAGNKVKL